MHAPVLPYAPFKTFLAAIEGFERALPNQIDRSVWPSYSGAIQGQLLAAFRFFSLLDDGNCPTAELRELSAKRETRRAVLARLIESCYAPLVALDLTHASPRRLEEEIRRYGLTGATHRKAMSFFLQACRYAGVPLSPLLRSRLRAGGAGGAHRRAPAGAAQAQPQAAALSRTVRFASGGTLTLTADVDLFSLSPEDRAFLFRVIDTMQGYDGGR